MALMYRKKPRVVKVLPQTGKRKSVEKDRKKKALAPGRRISKTGRKYTETRRNRSDKRKRRI